jgi:hypothetical protein
MDTTLAQISVDLVLILRVLLGFLWGAGLAAYLQLTRHGQFMATERTWLTVVAGIGVDLLIAYPGDWWTVVAVITASSVGIITRSLLNEQKRDEVNWTGYKVKHGLEDAAAVAMEVIKLLGDTLQTNGLPAKDVAQISQTLAKALRLKEIILAARRGETLSK